MLIGIKHAQHQRGTLRSGRRRAARAYQQQNMVVDSIGSPYKPQDLTSNNWNLKFQSLILSEDERKPDQRPDIGIL